MKTGTFPNVVNVLLLAPCFCRCQSIFLALAPRSIFIIVAADVADTANFFVLSQGNSVNTTKTQSDLARLGMPRAVHPKSKENNYQTGKVFITNAVVSSSARI